ncbi:MAG: nucleotidyltransferase domain-containing protein [bacterium]
MTSEEVKKAIQDILKKLITSYAPQKGILFGSYANGNPRPYSDIDLLIIKETPERLIDRLFSVRQILSDPKRRFPFGILVLTPQELSKRLEIGDQFVAEILEKGKILYGA